MENLLHELRYGARILLKRPAFTLVALFTLALGIGGSTMMFTVMNAIVLRPFPFLDTDGLVVLSNSQPYDKVSWRPLSATNVVQARQRADLFSDVGAFQAFYFNDPGQGRRPEQLYGQIVSSGFFEALGVHPILGRTVTSADELPGRDNVVVLSHRLWMRRFAGDSGAIGREFPLEGRMYRVIGVMPEGFSYPVNSELWGAMTMSEKDLSMHGYFVYDAVARLRDSVSVEAASNALKGSVNGEKGNEGIAAHLLLEMSVEGARGPMAIMAVAVALVLLIACTNVANLLMSRSTSRRREIAVRAALGAKQARIIRQLLVESVLLAMVGGSLGVLLAMWGVELLTTVIPVDVARDLAGWSHISVDTTALLFTLALSILTGIVFGLLPAVRSSKPDLSDALKEGNTMVLGGRRGVGFRNSLVVVEVAVALVLLVGAVLLIRTYVDLRGLNRGYSTDRVLSMEISLPDSTYPTPRDVAGFFDRAVERVRRMPHVEAVSVVGPHPVGPLTAIGPYQVVDAPPVDRGERPTASFRTIGRDYPSVLGIPLLAGRSFTRSEETNDSRSILIDDRLARFHFGSSARSLGRAIVLGNDTTPCMIVGVVGEVRGVNGERPGRGAIYLPIGFNPRRTSNIIVRVRPDNHDQAISSLISALGDVDRNQAVSAMRTLDEMISSQLVGRSLVTIAIALFAIIALLLAAVGIYSVIAYSIEQRTHEIGLRMALGANEGRVLGLMVRQGMTPVLIGVGIGLAVAIGLGASLLELVFGATPSDPLTYIAVAAGLVVVALLACYIPARRAVRVDPVVALRYE